MIKYFKFICFLFIILFSANAYCATIFMSANKQIIAEGDALLLTITYSDNYTATGNNNKQLNGVDFNVFNKDFDVVSKSFSSQDGFFNGSFSTKKIWKIGLKPKRSGKITIEPIKIGDAISNYIDIEVKETSDVSYVPDSNGSAYSPYFKIEQSIDTTTPYVQQQVIFWVKVLDNIGLKNGTININTGSYNDWFLVPLTNEPITKKETINNRQMNAYYFAYAGFPQKSGELNLPQFVFDGAYIKSNNFDFSNVDDDMILVGSLFNSLIGQTVPVKMQTKAQKINVKPIPKGFTAENWLPLKDLKITSSWSENTKFVEGEAVNRKINITANGLHSSYFPKINFKDINNIKQYPEKPIISEQINNTSLVTDGTINNVYIPQKAGEITLPSIEIDWFNVKTNKVEKAVIPGEKINVLPGLMPSVEENKKDIKVEEISTVDTSPVKDNYKININLYLILYVVIGIFLLFIFIYYIKYLRNKNKLSRIVIKSIKSCDYKKTKDSLILWGKAKFLSDDINNLHDLILLINNDAFTEQLLLLNKILYSKDDELFDVIKFIEIFKKVDKMKKKIKVNDNILPDLYD